MVTLKEDKKREILEFLEANATDDDLLLLEFEQIVESFADETFEKEAIREIISELDEDKLISTKTATLQVIYPVSHEDSIEKKFAHLFERSIFTTFLVGFVSLLVLFEQGVVFDAVFADAISDPNQLVFQALFVCVVGSYMLVRVILTSYDKLRANVDVVDDYRYIVVPTFGIGSAMTIIAFAYSNYTAQPITTATVVQLVTGSILGGIAVGELFLKDK